MRMYDVNRGLATLLGAAIAGGLIWVAGAYIGRDTTGGFWASMGIVAGAGLVLALMRMTGGLGRGLRPFLSPSVFLLAFVPTVVVVAWTLLATQPAGGWGHHQVVSWSTSIGIMHLIRDLAFYDAVLAFGAGAVLGMSFGSVPVETERDVIVRHDPIAADEPVSAERNTVADPAVADRTDAADRTYTRVGE